MPTINYLIKYINMNALQVRLSGVSKNLSSYSYSGFDQLVSISSGVVRYLWFSDNFCGRQVIIK